MSILGNKVRRIEDPRLLTVGGTYIADLQLDNPLVAYFVCSNIAHARIRQIDTSAAMKAPGVVGVLTAKDLDLPPIVPTLPLINKEMKRPYLASETVRFVGEPVVCIVGESLGACEDASELVVIDYDSLPVLVDPEKALSSDTVIHEAAGTNLVLEIGAHPDPSFFDGCEVVVSQRMLNQRLAPCPLETRGAAAYLEEGRLVFHVSTQAPHAVKEALKNMLGLTDEQVRVVALDVGGGFGSKATVYPEELLVAWIATRFDRPVRWVESRSESMIGLGHGRGQVQQVSIGGRSDGKIIAYSLEIVQDAGAYPAIGSFLPQLTRMMAVGTYAIERVAFWAASVTTNTVPVVAYRGAGRPEATAAIERAVDIFAHEIGMDPAEVRRRNLIDPSSFPYTSPTGTTYDSGNYGAALDKVLKLGDYKTLREEQARRRATGSRFQLGIGLSVYVEITNGLPSSEFGAVEVLPNGSVPVRAGTSPHGQGHHTAFAMIASEVLGVPLDSIEVITGDTDRVPRGVGTFGSRSMQTGGVAVEIASTKVVEQAKELAADLLEADPADVTLGRGGFHVIGAPAVKLSFKEIASLQAKRGERLFAEVDFRPDGPTFPFGAHLAVVEVDVETGKVVLRSICAVDDAGKLVNPLLAEGQVHGGIAQGVAQALYEEMIYDESGNPLTSTLAEYPFLSAAELPSFVLSEMETPSPVNLLGVKGIGESGTIGSTPAVQNAVVDALAHLGVRHLDMPTTPERLWSVLRYS